VAASALDPEFVADGIFNVVPAFIGDEHMPLVSALNQDDASVLILQLNGIAGPELFDWNPLVLSSRLSLLALHDGRGGFHRGLTLAGRTDAGSSFLGKSLPSFQPRVSRPWNAHQRHSR
jgi:hypothetical protein